MKFGEEETAALVHEGIVQRDYDEKSSNHPRNICVLLLIVIPAIGIIVLAGRVSAPTEVGHNSPILISEECVKLSFYNSTSVCENILSGYVCNVTCNIGFFKDSDDPLCSSGRWTSLPKCVEATLPNVLKQAVGVYKSRDVPQLQNTVVIMIANGAFVDFVMNWVCFAKKLDLRYFVECNDLECQRLLHEQNVLTYFDKTLVDITTAQDWLSKDYMRTVRHKMEQVVEILEFGYDVFMSDADVVILRDPFPFFQFDSDIEYLVDNRNPFTKTYLINGGCYLAKSNNRTIDMFVRSFNSCIDGTHEDCRSEQQSIKRTMEELKAIFLRYDDPLLTDEPTVITVRGLNPLQFPNGNIEFMDGREDFVERLKDSGMDKDGVVLVHTNWMVGIDKKKGAMQTHNYWLFDDGQCSNGTVGKY